MLSEHERYHGLGMDALATVCSWNTNVIMVWAWMLWQPYALGTRTLSCFGQGRIANRMFSEHERYHALGMAASPTVCSWNTNVIMVWAWPHWQPCALGTRTLSWFGHGRIWQPYALGTRTLSWLGHGRIGNPVLSEHDRYHGLGMGALASVCSSCLLCPDPDKMPSSGRCFHIRSQVHVAATRTRCQPRAPHGVASLCQAGADRLTFRNVRFIRGHSWRTYLKQRRVGLKQRRVGLKQRRVGLGTWASRPILRCFRPILRCFRPTLRCFRPTLRCFRPTLRCFRPTLRCFRPILRCFRPILRCFRPIPRCEDNSLKRRIEGGVELA